MRMNVRLFNAFLATAAFLATGALAQHAHQASPELDRLFADRKADAAAIDALTARIGATLGRLRASHLKAHVETTALLTPAQVDGYVEARGYAKGSTPHHHHR